MKRCLDEAMLQSYFDGELSTSLMESATSHLASCVTCTAAARELEEENALLSEAFALDFSESVPTERLRRRIDSAVSGLQLVRPVVREPHTSSGFFSSLSKLFSFSVQRTLGYAALMVVLAFGVIFGLVKLRSSQTQPLPPVSAVIVQPGEQLFPNNDREKAEQVTPERPRSAAPVKSRLVARAVPAKVAPVKLIPGERAYLQTIAKLDTTIKGDKNNMRPALQVEYERNLAVVDRAIAATRNAAKNNPSDPDAADFMFAAYQSKVDLLNTIADARSYNRTH